MQRKREDGQLSLFGQDSGHGKTCLEFSPAADPKGTTSVSSSRKPSGSKTVPVQCLDLTEGAGDLLGRSYWEMDSAWLGGYSTRNSGVSPSEGRECSLSQILEDSPHPRYYLSSRACLGILRRVAERGKALPPLLQRALEIQAGMAPPDPQMFNETAGSPSDRGNMMPSVLCFTDQGGKFMSCSNDVSGTLRAQEHGHQPLVFDWHPLDIRIRGPVEKSQTITTNGSHLPLTLQEAETFCISGSIIDRQPHNGGNGIGYQQDLAYTLTTADRHAVFARQRVNQFRESEIAPTESARQCKDATDLVCQRRGPLLVRRLTPLECERLQGFPDGWTDIPGASNSARYKALGNSVAIPCVEYIMQGITWAAGGG